MKSVLRQLNAWRFRERMIRVAWGSARWLAIVGSVLAVACLFDWLIDRYSGSKAWRDFFRSSRVFAPSDPLSAGETPFWVRVLMTASQIGLAGVLLFYFLIRPWRQTPPVDDLATQAEKAFPAFDHRLVTAIQLNRTTADTRGMSQTLIGEVTREAGEIADKHNLLSLVNYRRLLWALAALVPVAAIWGAFAGIDPTLATILVKRQALLDVDIPRNVDLENITQEVWPTGAEVIVRYKVTGRVQTETEGVLRVVPFEPDLGAEVIKQQREESSEPEVVISKVESGGPAARAGLRAGDVIQKFDNVEIREYGQFSDQFGKKRPGEKVNLRVKRGEDQLDFEVELATNNHPEEFYPLVHEETTGSEEYHFVAKLPPSSRDFNFTARLGPGRTKTPGHVTFEAPPQLAFDSDPNKPPLTAEQVLPRYLGLDPDGDPYTRRNDGWTRGEVIDALPQSKVIVDARFNKPVAKGKARLIPIEREGLRERELPPILPFKVANDRLSASFGFDTKPRMIGYRLELEDDRGFTNPVQIRRNIRMWEDRPPVVDFKPESTRNPNPWDFYGQGNPKDYEWDMALGPNGVVVVTFNGHSDVGVRAANIRYRVIPKGVQFDHYPEEYKRIQHPREDPNLIVYDRLPLTRFSGKFDVEKLRPFVPRRGLFELVDRVRCYAAGNIGPFDPDLGLFRYSYQGIPGPERNRVNVEFLPFLSRNPVGEPGEVEGVGRYHFEASGLLKKIPERQPDGSVVMKTAKIDVGDTVEVYVEVFDKVGAAGQERAANLR